MKNKGRKTGQTARLKDLPAKGLTKGEETKVKGGTVPPIAGNRRPKSSDTIGQ